MQFTPVHFYTREDIVVVGQHFEAADWDNPNGYLYGTQQYVMVSNEHGDTFELAVDSEAEQLAERLNARWKNYKKLPLNFNEWRSGRAIYGSEAYIEYGIEEEIAWERKLEDDYR
jgi:hypothetical protein